MSLRRLPHLINLVSRVLEPAGLARLSFRVGVTPLLAVLLKHATKLNVAVVELFPSDVPRQLVGDVVKVVLAVAHSALVPHRARVGHI